MGASSLEKDMESAPVYYLGKPIQKKHFRTYIYGVNGEKKLVESWDEYEAHMQTGIWLDTLDAIAEKIESKRKPRKPKEKLDEMIFRDEDSA